MTLKPPSIALQNQQGPQRFHQDHMGAGGNAIFIKGTRNYPHGVHPQGMADPIYERWQQQKMFDRQIPPVQHRNSQNIYSPQSTFPSGHFYPSRTVQTDDEYNDMGMPMPPESAEYGDWRQPSVETCSDSYMNDAKQKPYDYHESMHQNLKERHKEINKLKRDASDLKKRLKELNAQVDEKEQDRIAIVNRTIPNTIICKGKSRLQNSTMPCFSAESTTSTEETNNWKKASDELCRGVGSMTLVLCKVLNCTSQSVLNLLCAAENLAKKTCGAASLDDENKASEADTKGEEIQVTDKSGRHCQYRGKNISVNDNGTCTRDLNSLHNIYNEDPFYRRNFRECSNYDYSINHAINYPRGKYTDHGQDALRGVKGQCYFHGNQPDMFINYNAMRAPPQQHPTPRMAPIQSSAPVFLGNNIATYDRSNASTMGYGREAIHVNGDMANTITRHRINAPMGYEEPFGSVNNRMGVANINTQRNELPRRNSTSLKVPAAIAPTQRPPPLVAVPQGDQGIPAVMATGNRVPVTRVETQPPTISECTESINSEYTLGAADETTQSTQQEVVKPVEKMPSVEVINGMHMAKSDSSNTTRASVSQAEEKMRRKRRSFFYKNKIFLHKN